MHERLRDCEGLEPYVAAARRCRHGSPHEHRIILPGFEIPIEELRSLYDRIEQREQRRALRVRTAHEGRCGPE